MDALVSDTALKEHLRVVFHSLDKGSTGFVSLSAIKKALSKLCPEAFTDDALSLFFSEVEIESNGCISFSAFINCFAPKRKPGSTSLTNNGNKEYEMKAKPCKQLCEVVPSLTNNRNKERDMKAKPGNQLCEAVPSITNNGNSKHEMKAKPGNQLCEAVLSITNNGTTKHEMKADCEVVPSLTNNGNKEREIYSEPCNQLCEAMLRLGRHFSADASYILNCLMPLLQSMIGELCAKQPDEPELETFLALWHLQRCTAKDEHVLGDAISAVKQLMSHRLQTTIANISQTTTANISDQPPELQPCDRFLKDSSCVGHEFRAVSIHYLSTVFLDEVYDAGLSLTSSVLEIEPPVIRAKGENVICPRDDMKGAAYVDCVADGCSIATLMLSYTWGYSIGDIVSGLIEYCRNTQRDYASHYVWMCCLCINQHRVTQARARGDVIPFEDFKKVFGDRVRGIGTVVSLVAPWRDPVNMKRVWCDYEMFTAIELGKDVCTFEITMPKREFADLHSSLMWGTGIAELWETLAALKIQNAEASVQADKQKIFRMIEDGPGFHSLNSTLAVSLRTWVVQSSERYLRERLAQKNIPAEDASLLCLRLANLFVLSGRSKDALATLSQGLGICEEANMVETVQGALLLKDAARLKRRGGFFEDALADYDRAMHILHRTAAHQSADGAELLAEIGKLKNQRGDCQGALSVLHEARDVLDTKGQLKTVQGANLLIEIGAVHQKLDQMHEAFNSFAKAYEIFELTGTLNTPESAKCVGRMGGLKFAQGDMIEALKHYEESKRIMEVTSTLQTLGGAVLMKKIGDLYLQQGNTTSAHDHLIESHRVMQITASLESTSGAALLHSLGKVHQLLGKPHKAHELFEQALGVYRAKNFTLDNAAGKELTKDFEDVIRILENVPPVRHVHFDLKADAK